MVVDHSGLRKFQQAKARDKARAIAKKEFIETTRARIKDWCTRKEQVRSDAEIEVLVKRELALFGIKQ